MALLILAVEHGCGATAVHVDHGLRPGSDAEAELVEAVAAEVGAAFRAERVEVGDGPNLEARARAARRSVLPPDALYGHTADDQAETMLLNLLRGAGIDGLAAMRPAGHPLLRIRRSETAALCAARGISIVDDPSNHEGRFRRNRVRAELVPLLDDIAERDVAGVLARQSAIFADVSDLLAELAAGIDPTDARGLARAPRPIAAVAVRRWIRDVTRSEHPCDEGSVERVLAVAAGTWRATEVGGGWRVARRAGQLRLEPPDPRNRYPDPS